MSDSAIQPDFARAQTDVIRRVVAATRDLAMIADLLFLERWEMVPIHGPAAALRASQIRRANPALAEQVRAEVARSRRP